MLISILNIYGKLMELSIQNNKIYRISSLYLQAQGAYII